MNTNSIRLKVAARYHRITEKYGIVYALMELQRNTRQNFLLTTAAAEKHFQEKAF